MKTHKGYELTAEQEARWRLLLPLTDDSGYGRGISDNLSAMFYADSSTEVDVRLKRAELQVPKLRERADT